MTDDAMSGKRRNLGTESITEVIPLLEPQYAGIVDAAIAAHAHRPGALLPILHAVQDAIGFVPAGAVAPIANALALTRADVHGVISFYHDFRRAPPPRHVLKLCRAEACQAMGARALQAHAQGLIDVRSDLLLEAVHCLGNCALSPAVMLDGQLHGRVTPQRLDALLDAVTRTSDAY